MGVRWRRLITTWLLPLALGACGGNGCSGCSEIIPQPTVPTSLLIQRGVQLRVSQKGFDLVADNIVGLLKALFGATAGGAAKIDVSKLLPGSPLKVSGGLGLFSGTASVRDLVLSLDLDKLAVTLVQGASPARVRIAIDKADLGVIKGVVAGQASFLGIKSDAACHLQNGVDVGTPDARIATVSATIDLVLDVDAAGKLAIKAEVADPVLHDIGFRTKKDCALTECKDQILLEDPCLECGVCATGKLTSDIAAAMKNFLKPVLSQVLALVTNLLIKQVIEPSLNGKSLDLELGVDLAKLVKAASPQLGALFGEGKPLRVRARPAPSAFSVTSAALRARFDGAVFAKAHGCVVSPGADSTSLFAELPQTPAPPLPAKLSVKDENGALISAELQAGAMLARGIVEEALWAVLRSGVLCSSVDAHALYALSDKKIVLVTAALDLALPGLRQLTRADAPLRLTVVPSASHKTVPRIQLSSDGAGGVTIRATLRQLGLTIEAAVMQRWLTLVEASADAVAVLSVRVDQQERLVVTVVDVEVPEVKVAESALFPQAQMDVVAGPIAQLGLSLLLSEPMVFDVDVNAMLADVLKLPIDAAMVGLQVMGAGQDWLLVGIKLAAKGTKP